MPTVEKRLKIPTGNAKRIRFTLRVKGKGAYDVSLASSIKLEMNKGDETAHPPIICNSSMAGADWTKGIVIALIPTSPYLDVEDELDYGLTITIGDEVVTVVEGVIEVTRRPGS